MIYAILVLLIILILVYYAMIVAQALAESKVSWVQVIQLWMP